MLLDGVCHLRGIGLFRRQSGSLDPDISTIPESERQATIRAAQRKKGKRLWKLPPLWKSANNADSHSGLGRDLAKDARLFHSSPRRGGYFILQKHHGAFEDTRGICLNWHFLCKTPGRAVIRSFLSCRIYACDIFRRLRFRF